MISKTKKKDLAPLAKYVNEIHEGNLLALTNSLDRAIYMFHYLTEEENFTQPEKQNTCYALVGIRERLMEAYYNQHGMFYARLD